VEIVRRYANRIQALHLKDWIRTDPSAAAWYQRGRFCELGAGNIGMDNAEVLRVAVQLGFNGWVFVEQDIHLQEPVADLTVSREYLRRACF
jgi:sugar phosphate isomerase/epimerase